MAKFGLVLQIGDIWHKRNLGEPHWRSSTRGRLAKFGYRLFRHTSRIFKTKKVSYYILAWDFLGLPSSQNVPQKKRKKKEKQKSHFDWPIGHAQIESYIYICIWVSFFHFVFSFSLYIIVKIPWQI
jgi:hypothetical protein